MPYIYIYTHLYILYTIYTCIRLTNSLQFSFIKEYIQLSEYYIFHFSFRAVWRHAFSQHCAYKMHSQRYVDIWCSRVQLLLLQILNCYPFFIACFIQLSPLICHYDLDCFQLIPNFNSLSVLENMRKK